MCGRRFPPGGRRQNVRRKLLTPQSCMVSCAHQNVGESIAQLVGTALPTALMRDSSPFAELTLSVKQILHYVQNDKKRTCSGLKAHMLGMTEDAPYRQPNLSSMSSSSRILSRSSAARSYSIFFDAFAISLRNDLRSVGNSCGGTYSADSSAAAVLTV